MGLIKTLIYICIRTFEDMGVSYKFLLILILLVVSAMCIDNLTGRQSTPTPIETVYPTAGVVAITSTPIETASSKNPALTIESLWNESTVLKFTVRLMWSGMTIEEFAKTKFYIGGAETACSPDSAAALSAYDLRVIICPANSYGTCVGGVCPTRTIKVVSVDGTFDIATYQYR